MRKGYWSVDKSWGRVTGSTIHCPALVAYSYNWIGLGSSVGLVERELLVPLFRDGGG
uniref:Uncharacterized protein n=2 Tax=Picea TaxID=3328 RepID=A0A101LUS6_PICGL|nr:hypothetical protein ABT39_MTgene2527 [Picea glauca]QHR92909.1 hypothetical protein Q903MT_gene6959 [Picea sitchensis]